jgi:hypothetical protein
MARVDAGHLEYLRRTHDFDTWSGKDEPPRLALEANAVKASDLPGFELVRTPRVERVGIASLDSLLRRVGSAGRTVAPEDDVLLRLQVFQLASIGAARAHLLETLAEFESAAIKRRTDLSIGDVVFGLDTALLFAKDNLVVLLRNVGRQAVSILAVAETIDAALNNPSTKATP